MGIRFFCPNGHKLNVKEHLAGKAGFCPECGVRLVIPYQSTRKSSKELGQEKTEPAPNSAAENPVFSLTPSSFFIEEMQQQEATHQQEAAAQAFQSFQAPVAPTPAPEPVITNPILQDQTRVWYIQVPNGPQYGPATGLVVQTWLQERRIGPTMLVWCEGWNNWLEAKNVFPELE